MAAASSLSGAKRKQPEPAAVEPVAIPAAALAAAAPVVAAAAPEAGAAAAAAADRKTPAQRAHEESLRKRVRG